MLTNDNQNEEDRIFNRLSQDAESGRQKGGEILFKATRIAGSCHLASLKHKITEPISRKERSQFGELVRPMEASALLEWAQNNSFFITTENFQNRFAARKIGEGAEQEVYLAESGKTVIKTNDAIMHSNWLEFFDRIALHNWLFPETAYVVAGFTLVKERLATIIEQPFLYSNRGASREEVEKDLDLRGFRRIKNDDYYSPSLGIILEDLHDENVLIAGDNLLLYFDPIVYLETVEMKLGGKDLYRFPFG